MVKGRGSSRFYAKLTSRNFCEASKSLTGKRWPVRLRIHQNLDGSYNDKTSSWSLFVNVHMAFLKCNGCNNCLKSCESRNVTGNMEKLRALVKMRRATWTN